MYRQGRATRRGLDISVVAALCIAVLLGWLHTSTGPSHQIEAAGDWEHSVAIGDNYFMPNVLVARVGDTVTWVNRGKQPHIPTNGNSSNPSARWDSPILNPGGSFSYTLTANGIFNYFCRLHPWMRGTAVVEPARLTPDPTSTLGPTSMATPTAVPAPTRSQTQSWSDSEGVADLSLPAQARSAPAAGGDRHPGCRNCSGFPIMVLLTAVAATTLPVMVFMTTRRRTLRRRL